METIYADKTTPELLDLLVAEEDRVTLEHIRELAARADAVEPLRAWLLDEERWQSASLGVGWSFYHAFTILCLTRRVELLDDLLAALRHAQAVNFDWLLDIGAAGLAQLGEAALEPLLEALKATFTESAAERAVGGATAHRELIVHALYRLAVEYPAARAQLGAAVGGDFSKKLAIIEKVPADKRRTLSAAFLEFYQPAEIAARQARWQNLPAEEAQAEAEEQARQAARERLRATLPSGVNPFTRAGLGLRPAGYAKTDTGTLVRETRVGRNDPCPCGSGKKYKKCCGA